MSAVMEPTTGMTLRLERTAARLTIKQVAARMKVGRETVWRWETAETVRPEIADRYRAAIGRQEQVA